MTEDQKQNRQKKEKKSKAPIKTVTTGAWWKNVSSLLPKKQKNEPGETEKPGDDAPAVQQQTATLPEKEKVEQQPSPVAAEEKTAEPATPEKKRLAPLMG